MAVHSTRLGQALGGARLWRYGQWTDGLADALRLSQAMTMKNAAAGLARGGGKSVVAIPAGVTLDDAQKRDAMLDLGDAVESLGGAYMTAEDVGTSAELMAVVHERTEHVCGLPPEQGGVGEPRRRRPAYTPRSSRRSATCSARPTRPAVTWSSRASARSAVASRAASRPPARD